MTPQTVPRAQSTINTIISHNEDILMNDTTMLSIHPYHPHTLSIIQSTILYHFFPPFLGFLASYYSLAFFYKAALYIAYLLAYISP